jgi:chromosome segregation ATPase
MTTPSEDPEFSPRTQTQREDRRHQAEHLREQAEAQRETEEARRQTQERRRQEAEERRQAAEEDRQVQEELRRTTESLRLAMEDLRREAEAQLTHVADTLQRVTQIQAQLGVEMRQMTGKLQQVEQWLTSLGRRLNHVEDEQRRS